MSALIEGPTKRGYCNILHWLLMALRLTFVSLLIVVISALVFDRNSLSFFGNLYATWLRYHKPFLFNMAICEYAKLDNCLCMLLFLWRPTLSTKTVSTCDLKTKHAKNYSIKVIKLTNLCLR